MDEAMDSSADYVWHFKLSDDEVEGFEADALTEMLREQLRAILECVVLTSNGVHLRVTGFRFLAEPKTDHLLFPEAAQSSPARAEVEPGSG